MKNPKEDLTPRTVDVLQEVYEERIHQVKGHGYSLSSDDRYELGQLSLAAAACAVGAANSEISRRTVLDVDYYKRVSMANDLWPWDLAHFKGGTARRKLIRAAALIVAEIERLDRR